MAKDVLGGAHHFVLNAENVIAADTYIHREPSSTGSLEKLTPWIATTALHDANERCDAPKCHPETRAAVQDEIYSWVVHGDADPQPKRIKWVTGPAGTGKSAIMGSMAEWFSKEGLLAASFFFSSSSPHPEQRTKMTLIPTIAYQLAEHHESFKHAVGRAIEASPLVFKKNLQVQMEQLLLQPLNDIQGKIDLSGPPKVIVIDGLDECDIEKELYPAGGGQLKPARKKDDEHLEILQMLLQLSSHTSFPFRILIASRPERAIRNFFKFQEGGVSFAVTLELDEKYNPDADIKLFLEAKFTEMARHSKLGTSWPPVDTILALVAQASGQFIYAATVVRFIMDDTRPESFQSLLDVVLKVKPIDRGPTSVNPFVNLDALYTQILNSSPNPRLAVHWIWITQRTILGGTSANFVNQFLGDGVVGADKLLGTFHSLIKIPPSDDMESRYSLYHKSLSDFLEDPSRAGDLFISSVSGWDFFTARYFQICLHQGPRTTPPNAGVDKLIFLNMYFNDKVYFPSPSSCGDNVSEIFQASQAVMDWWTSNIISSASDRLTLSFDIVHRMFNMALPWILQALATFDDSRMQEGRVETCSIVDHGTFVPPQKI